jgi:hypothetical protein
MVFGGELDFHLLADPPTILYPSLVWVHAIPACSLTFCVGCVMLGGLEESACQLE